MHSSSGTENRKRLVWIAAVRALLCVFVAGILFLNAPPAPDVRDLLPYVLVAAVFLVNLGFVALWRAGAPSRPLVGAQIWLDILFISGLVYFTGGVGSDFLLLYFGPILAAAVFFRRSIALLAASLATIGLFFTAAAYYATLPGTPPLVAAAVVAEGRPAPGALFGVLVMQGAALYVVVFLASTLALRLHSASIRTERILENMSDGVITVEESGRIVYSNSRAREMLELGPSEVLVGRPFGEVVPDAADNALGAVIRTLTPAGVELEIGSRPTPVMVTILPLAAQAGGAFGRRGSGPRGANVILQDLTERRRLTEALTRAERLEATAATVASIAHEIRNPLAAIRGSTQELKKVLDLSGPDERLMDLVVGESDRLNCILTDFLNFSRMPKPQLGAVEIHGLLEEVAAEIASSPLGRAADIEVSEASEAYITADGEQLRQVFLNLGLNALDATEGRGPVVFRMEETSEGVLVRTLDAGHGVETAIREQIFEPFFTTKTTGTGLGLSIARRIIEDHSGTLELEEWPEGWTCVKVFLPFAEGKAKPPESSKPAAAVETG